MSIVHWLFLGVAALVLGLVGYGEIRQRWTQRKYGYSVRSVGGAEEGFVSYAESGREIWLYFERASDTIYVPSDQRWREVMPSWAKERKQEIMPRIKKEFGKKLIGKGWTYQETSDMKLMTQPDLAPPS